MTSNDRNGKHVKAFWFDGHSYRPTVGEVFILENKCYGDRNEDWIVRRTVGEHKETARHNVRLMQSIEWMPE